MGLRGLHSNVIFNINNIISAGRKNQEWDIYCGDGQMMLFLKRWNFPGSCVEKFH